MSIEYPHVPPERKPWDGYQVTNETGTALARLDAELWTKGFENNEPFVWAALRHVCDQLMDGRSLKAILIEDRERADGTPRPLPPRNVLIAWLERAEQLRSKVEPNNPYIVFSAMEKVARKGQIAALIDDCLPIADDAERDFKTVYDNDGNVKRIFDREHVQRATLRIKTRLHLVKIARANRFAFEDDPEPIRPEEKNITDIEDVVSRAEQKTQGLPSSLLQQTHPVKR